MKSSLSALACFNQVENISEITSGLSQHCFTVHADNKVYFAKTINGNTETQLALAAAKEGFSPVAFYHDQHWLITDFINGDNLALSTIEHLEKASHGISLMVQCHQLNVKPDELSPGAIMSDLITKGHFSAQQKNDYLRLTKLLLPPLSHPKRLVCCHGDLNFSNILIDQKKHTWLIDYECACIAPAEFDLAMFIAVNNITENKISIITKQYEHQFPSVKINSKLLYNYLAFSYFINSLWYANAYQSRSDTALLNLHQQQWKKLISLMPHK